MKLIRNRYNLLLLIPIVIPAIVFYIFCQSANPDSRWCNYKIYKQPNGTYEVWWVGRFRDKEGIFLNYDDAKAFQVKSVNNLIEIVTQRPKGELVK
jgi:hypothetical protein